MSAQQRNHHHFHTLSKERKTRSCENLFRQQPDMVTMTTSHRPQHRRNQIEDSTRPPLPPDGYSLKQNNYRGSPHSHFECPVEVQTQQPHPQEEVQRLTQEMEEAFLSKRKIAISGFPTDCSSESLTSFCEGLLCKPVSKLKDGAIRVIFPSAADAKDNITIINSTMFKCHKLSASYGHPDSLLFVGNLPYTYACHDLVNLFESCGEILRCFVVYSPESGLSKGYGFVEFSKREEALFAKQQKATKVIGLRSLRVDFSDNGMQTCEDLHSQTLFVDRLPKGFIEDGSLKEYFSQYGRVNFCQVAVAPHTGVSRGFAFVDMSTSQEAEHAQLDCNGGTFHGQEIRVSFGMPCRHGACILQHRNNGPYNVAKHSGPMMAPLTYTHKLQENTPYSLHHHDLPYCHRDEPLRIHTPSYPLKDSTNCPLSDSLSHTFNTSLMRSASLSNLDPSEAPPQPSWGISKSRSAPTVLTPHPSPPSHLHKDDDVFGHTLLRKRSAPELDCYDRDDGCSVYDKPYIGQHQQGIPFMHPLKRIRMDNN